MADLKAGTTVGGSLVWHQGNFPLSAVTDDVYYKSYKIYTEYNKPQAVDNDFVSKSQGGTYLGSVTFDVGFNIKDKNGYLTNIGIPAGPSPLAARIQVGGKFGFETSAGTPFAFFDPSDNMDDPRLVVMGPMLAGTLWESGGRVYSEGNKPKAVDVGLGNVTNDAQVKINTVELQTMAGPLKAPNFTSINIATNGDHVPRYDQVIAKNVVIDFEYY